MRATRTYLELRDPGALHPARSPSVAARIERMARCPPSFYRYLYHEVGYRWRWWDRSKWSDERIQQHLDQPEISVWLLTATGAPAGYFELRREAEESVEIAYFGLLPEFLGLGLGGHLLTEAARAAWALHPRRVWLHTCTFDHPAALPNYQARGFHITRTEEYEAADLA